MGSFTEYVAQFPEKVVAIAAAQKPGWLEVDAIQWGT